MTASLHPPRSRRRPPLRPADIGRHGGAGHRAPAEPTTNRRATTERATARRTGLAALLATAALLVPQAVAAQPAVDPNLDQTLSSDLQIVHGDHVLGTGHVDLGPKFDEGQWRFLVHDDAAKADANGTSVWRYPAEAVVHLVDEGRLTVPDDPQYDFLGAEAGSDVWVVPQTQNPAVVWLGWNTQDPEVMARIDRGVTLSLTGVQGPGIVTVYLQSGSFGEPELLWDSRVTEPQSIWVNVNTHTHANWVFTQPGVYLLELTASAELIDGTSVSDTQLLRFAVGTATSPDEARAAEWAGAASGTEAPPVDDGGTGGDGTAQDSAAGETGGDGGNGAAEPDAAEQTLETVLVAAIVVVAGALLVGFSLVLVRGARARRQALAAPAADEPEERPESPGSDGTAPEGTTR